MQYGVLSVLAREPEEILRLGDHGGPFGRADDRDTSAPAKLEQPFVAQDSQGAQDGVAVDAENGGEIPRGRQPLTGACLAV